MSGLITISHNIPAIQKRLTNLAEKVGTIQPALKGIGQAIELSTRNRFDAETGPDGKKWQPLKPSTVARKRKKNKPTKILLQDDHLRFNITSQVEGETLTVGSPQKYAAIHQLGGPAGRKSKQVQIPARPFLGISKSDEQDILHEIRQHLNL